MEPFLSHMQEYVRSAPLLAFAAAYAAGVLVSFTPCVYPVIPITLGYIGGRSAGGRGRGFLLSLSYALGLACVYAALGLFASLTGRLFGSVGAHPVSYFIAANICLVLGLSMFDVIQIPSLSFAGGGAGRRSGGFLGAFFVGMGSGLIVGPCTAPVLGAILLYVAKAGNVAYGTSLLFTFAMGMATLLILIGTFAGLLANLPKSGPWLLAVKKIFGVLLILAAEYFLVETGKRLL